MTEDRPLFFERKIDEVTTGLRPEYSSLLYNIPVQNAISIADYIELYFNERKIIREVAKEIKKSSRDVVAVVKKHKQKLRLSQMNIHRGDNVNQPKGDTIEPPVNVKAYELFIKGLTPLQVVSELKLSEVDATKYYVEYLRLKRLPKLSSTLERLQVPRKISLLIRLANLALAEHITANGVLQLLKMANSRVHGMYNIEQNIKKYRWVIANLRKTRQKEGLELVALHNKIRSSNDMLKQYNLAIKVKKRRACYNS
jgi:hypothetical protein